MPCTQSFRRYDFPSEKPLLRFLDTRGLAEADYNADEDADFLPVIAMLSTREKHANALQRTLPGRSASSGGTRAGQQEYGTAP